MWRWPRRGAGSGRPMCIRPRQRAQGAIVWGCCEVSGGRFTAREPETVPAYTPDWSEAARDERLWRGCHAAPAVPRSRTMPRREMCCCSGCAPARSPSIWGSARGRVCGTKFHSCLFRARSCRKPRCPRPGRGASTAFSRFPKSPNLHLKGRLMATIVFQPSERRGFAVGGIGPWVVGGGDRSRGRARRLGV